MAQEQGTPFRASEEDWELLENGPTYDERCILELRARVEALETPAPVAPVGGVTEEELAELLAGRPLGNLSQAEWMLNHPRIGPLLRAEGGKRVVLPEVPTEGSAVASLLDTRDRGCRWLAGWTAARAEVARQQGEA